MGLSSDLIDKFVKVTKDNVEVKNETTVYGTITMYNDSLYVKIDGSDLLTPVSTTSDIKAGDRVMVMLKDHTATVTGNITDPSASSDNLKEANRQIAEVGTKISEFEVIIAHKVAANDIEAITGRIDNLKVVIGTFTNLSANELSAINAEIDKIQSKVVDADYLTATDVKAIDADIENLRATFASFTNLTTEELNAANANIDYLKTYSAEFTYVSSEVLSAIKADIKKLDVGDLNAKYATIDFSNIGEAAVEKLFSESGIIKELDISTGKVTGELVGVTIKGDLIEGGTVKADKLVVKGSDGLFYKLNVEGGATTSSQVSESDLQNGLSGSVIVAKSITATKISVDDLVAFGATIGGFHISDHSIYSGVKSSISNTTPGLYFDDNGQVYFGDSTNYLKFYKDTDGTYKLSISADAMAFSSSGKTVEESITTAKNEAISGAKDYTDSITSDMATTEDMTAISNSVMDISDDAETMRNEISSIAGTVDEIQETQDSFVTVSVFEEKTSSLQIASEEIEATFTSSLKEVRDELVNEIQTRSAVIRATYDESNNVVGIEMGAEGNSISANLTNQELKFMREGEAVVSLSADKEVLDIRSAEITDALILGGFQWKSRSNGNMGLAWVGGGE